MLFCFHIVLASLTLSVSQSGHAGDPLVQPRGANKTPSNSYTYKGSSQSAGGATYGGGGQSSFVSPGKQTAKEAMRRARKPLSMKHCTSIIDGLKTIYFNKVSIVV